MMVNRDEAKRWLVNVGSVGSGDITQRIKLPPAS